MNDYFKERSAKLTKERDAKFFEEREKVLTQLVKADRHPDDLLFIATLMTKLSLVSFPDTFRNHKQ